MVAHVCTMLFLVVLGQPQADAAQMKTADQATSSSSLVQASAQSGDMRFTIGEACPYEDKKDGYWHETACVKYGPRKDYGRDYCASGSETMWMKCFALCYCSGGAKLTVMPPKDWYCWGIDQGYTTPKLPPAAPAPAPPCPPKTPAAPAASCSYTDKNANCASYTAGYCESNSWPWMQTNCKKSCCCPGSAYTSSRTCTSALPLLQTAASTSEQYPPELLELHEFALEVSMNPTEYVTIMSGHEQPKQSAVVDAHGDVMASGAQKNLARSEKK